MNFICSITHSLIKKSDPVRIFFLESHKDPSFPFMNYNQATSTGHFMPMGCGFKAKFEDDDHNEYFSFDLDNKESLLVKGLIDYINKNILSKEEAKNNNLLSHNSRDLIWGEVNSLQDLFFRINNQSIYFKKNHKEVFPFATVMVMHESAYQLMLKYGEIETAIQRHKKLCNDKKFLEKKEFEKVFIKNRREEVEACRGKTHKAMKEETVIVDEGVFKECIKRIEHLKDSEDPKLRACYNENVEEFKKDICTEKTLQLFRERFVDDAYIEWYMDNCIKDIIRMGDYENDALKKAAYNANTKNFVATLQVEELRLGDKWTQSNWLPILESYVVEEFMTCNGYEFLPSRRHYQYQSIENKDFFQEMTQLNVYD